MGLKERFNGVKLSEKLGALGKKFRALFNTHALPGLKTGAAHTLRAMRTVPERTKEISRVAIASKFWTPTFWKNLHKKIRARLPQNLDELKRMRPEEIAALVLGDSYEKYRKLFAGGKAYGAWFRMGVIAFAAYFLADTVSLFTEELIPEPPVVPAPKIVKKEEKKRSLDQYSSILTRNIFSSKNIIPEDEGAGGPARKTTLPLQLVGTMVLSDELKSIASIEDKTASMIYPVRVDDTVNNKIRVTKIEHLRVTFVNLSSGGMEYVEILDDFPQLNVRTPSVPTTSKPSNGVTMTSENRYEVEKGAIEKSLTNISQVLQQAKAVPNFENGMANGYRLIEIDPGSIFDSFGLKPNDVISAANGEPLNDPGKAFALFNNIRNIQHLELTVERGGRKTVMNYDVR